MRTLILILGLFLTISSFAQTNSNLPQRPIATFTTTSTPEQVHTLTITFYGEQQPIEAAKVALLNQERERLGTVYNRHFDTNQFHLLMNLSTLPKGTYYFEKIASQTYNKPLVGELLVIL